MDYIETTHWVKGGMPLTSASIGSLQDGPFDGKMAPLAFTIFRIKHAIYATCACCGKHAAYSGTIDIDGNIQFLPDVQKSLDQAKKQMGLDHDSHGFEGVQVPEGM